MRYIAKIKLSSKALLGFVTSWGHPEDVLIAFPDGAKFTLFEQSFCGEKEVLIRGESYTPAKGLEIYVDDLGGKFSVSKGETTYEFEFVDREDNTEISILDIPGL